MSDHRSSAPRALEQLPPKANLRPAEIALFLGCHVATVYALIHDGVIPAVKLTRCYVIPREKFLLAYESHTVEPQFQYFLALGQSRLFYSSLFFATFSTPHFVGNHSRVL